jgi:hypothetical protein
MVFITFRRICKPIVQRNDNYSFLFKVTFTFINNFSLKNVKILRPKVSIMTILINRIFATWLHAGTAFLNRRVVELLYKNTNVCTIAPNKEIVEIYGNIPV